MNRGPNVELMKLAQKHWKSFAAVLYDIDSSIQLQGNP